MGITGLFSYIQENSKKYLKDYHLRQCNVVVDGSNFLHYLYITSPKPNASFGGDYNVYADHIRAAFQLFKRCEVHPIVLLDGGLDVGDRKQKMRLFRARQKLIASIKVKPSNQHRMVVSPLLLKTVFLLVLKELQIEVIQCHYEADGDIAALARGLNCPVISNDSDFYVLDVLVIPLTTMELDAAVQLEGGQRAIQCKLFEMATFLKTIGYKDASNLPLLGTLLGNDYADKNLFENIFRHISLPKSKSMNDMHRRIQGLLEWLKEKDIEEAIDGVLNFVKIVHRTDVEVAIRTSLNAYEDDNNGTMDSADILREKIVAGLVEYSFPEWFARLYTDAAIPPWVLEVSVVHRMPYQSQVESVHSSNSFSCCSDLLKAVALICWDQQANNNLLTIWRRKSELAFVRMRIQFHELQVPMPRLSEIEPLTQPERYKLLLDLVAGECSHRLWQLPTKWQLVFAALIHWVRHSHCRVKSYHLDGLVAGLIHLSMVRPRIGKVKCVKRLDHLISSKAKDDPVMEYLVAAKNALKFQELDPRMLSRDTDYDRDTVHALAEFQATYYLTTTLQQVLGSSVPCTSPALFYCGTFACLAASHFKGHDRLVFAEKLYGPDSTLLQIFLEYTGLVNEGAPSTFSDWVPSGPHKPRPKRKKAKRAKKATRESTQPDTSSSSSGEDGCTEDEGIDLVSNRFGLLVV